MKTVKIFRKERLIANYTNVDKIIAGDDNSILTLITKDQKISIKQGVDVVMVYNKVQSNGFGIIKRNSKEYLIDLFMNIKNCTEDFNFTNVKIFEYKEIPNEFVSFYTEDDMRIDFRFMSKEAYNSVYIALKTSNI